MSMQITRPMTRNAYHVARAVVPPLRSRVDRVPDDEDAGHDEDRALGERGQMLGLPVAVLVTDVGGAHGDADGEEGQQRGDEICARVEPTPR